MSRLAEATVARLLEHTLKLGYHMLAHQARLQFSVSGDFFGPILSPKCRGLLAPL